MKITLNEEQTIKAKDYDAGDEVIVNKEFGERLIEEGLANRVIEEPENRIVEEPENRMKIIRFSGHRKIYHGTDGKTYERQGETYVEIEE